MQAVKGRGASPSPDEDRRWMSAALALGRRNAGRAWPNPAVGAVIVRDDGDGPRVVGRGWTAPGGRPHAETVALAQAGALARGATVYVSLEPCSHVGRTGPCSVALIEAGVDRVVSTLEDPDGRVAGDGHRMLREAGIAVTTGICAAEAAREHAGHIRRVRDGRPHVRLKLAVSADGFVGRFGERQVPISGEAARQAGHALRATADGILVGVGTALVDDPLLTCRLPGLAGRSPVRIVLDTHGRLPVDSALVRSAHEVPLWVIAGGVADPRRLAELEATGTTVIAAPLTAEGRIDLSTGLVALAERGLTTLLVEGGPRVATGLLEAGLVDEMVLIRAPDPIGGDGVPAFIGRRVEDVLADPAFVTLSERRLGEDRLVHLWRKD
jgi:diaminohydroxyphosphoribosylaminopyrimidine deaminase/5-amino-6-(5-phosphoribosylamino)uracil reductase